MLRCQPKSARPRGPEASAPRAVRQKESGPRLGLGHGASSYFKGNPAKTEGTFELIRPLPQVVKRRLPKQALTRRSPAEKQGYRLGKRTICADCRPHHHSLAESVEKVKPRAGSLPCEPGPTHYRKMVSNLFAQRAVGANVPSLFLSMVQPVETLGSPQVSITRLVASRSIDTSQQRLRRFHLRRD